MASSVRRPPYPGRLKGTLLLYLNFRTRNGSVSIWMSPMTLCSLQHICRLTIRRTLQSDDVRKIHLPPKLKDYLLYKPLLQQDNDNEQYDRDSEHNGASVSDMIRPEVAVPAASAMV